MLLFIKVKKFKMGCEKMKTIKFYQVDTFTNELFKGNPAGVCLLGEEISDSLMQKIAFEMNLSETAFLIPVVNEENRFSLRWFTPEVEVPLCGHATLASSAVLFEKFKISSNELQFETKSGILISKLENSEILLDFPMDEAVFDGFQINHQLLDALGIKNYENVFLGKITKKLIFQLKDKEEILNIKPNFDLLNNLDCSWLKGIGVTAIDDKEFDFISRYFNPWAGVNEDSVTGSVHTVLASYWADILDKTKLKCYQASRRSGEMTLKIKENDRVEISGKYKIALQGEILI